VNKVVHKPVVIFKPNTILKFKPDIKTNKKNKLNPLPTEMIMPSYEIIIKNNYFEFEDVWNESYRLLYRNARAYMEQHQKPLKVRIGVDFTIYKPIPLEDGGMSMDFLNDDEDEVKYKNKIEEIKYKFIKNYKMEFQKPKNHIYVDLNVSTKNISVYTPETMKEQYYQ
jgi:hypothetical protein